MRRSVHPIPVMILLALGLAVSPGCGDDDKPADPGNNPPVILSVTADPDTFYADQSTVVMVDVTDPDGDECQCTWEAHGLEMTPIGGTAMSITLKPGCDCLEEATDVWVVAIVSDGRGGEDSDSTAIWIEPMQ